MDAEITFRRLRDHEAEAGYQIIDNAFNWLLDQEIMQWPAPLSTAVYSDWQRRQANYGLFVWDNLAVVLSLVIAPLTAWPQVAVADEKVLWLRWMATAASYRGQQLGQKAVLHAIELANARMADLYVECVVGDGFLPAYFQALGFRPLQERARTIAHHSPLRMMLLRYGMWEL